MKNLEINRVMMGLLVVAAMLFGQSGRAADQYAKITLEPQGICISTPAEGQLVLEYPSLLDPAQKMIRPTGVTVKKNQATMQYPNGAKMTATLEAGTIVAHFTALPATAKGLRMEMTIPVSFKDGGQWQVGSAAAKPFPEPFAGEQFVFKGNPEPTKIITPKGVPFTLVMPHGWQQVQDNRKWNGEGFGYMTSCELPRAGAGECYHSFKVLAGDEKEAPATAPVVAAKPAPKAVPKTKLSFQLSNEGVAMDAGGMGHFTLFYPVLVGDRYDKVRKPIEKIITGNTVALKFDAGARIELALQPQTGIVTLTPASIPGDVRSIRMDMHIDFSYATGGTWKIGGSETPFPADKQPKPFLYQGTADQFTLRNFDGAALTFNVPQYSFQQLTDNREWGWKIFNWQFATPYQAGGNPMQVKVSIAAPSGGDAAQAKPLVDKFGQNTRMEYPDKVKSEADLKQDVTAEAAYLASLQPPAGDVYGGLPGSREKYGLKKTGYFHVEKIGPRWVLVDPEGNAFFHLGVCGMGPSDDYTYIKGREQIYEWLPPHGGEFKSAYHPNSFWNPDAVSFNLVNQIRKYGQPFDIAAYTARMIERVRKWGFNSAGAFSGADAGAREKAQFPSVAHLPLSIWEGFPEVPGAHGAFDPFDEKLRAHCEKVLSEKLPARANDPLIIGYFLVNEPLYEDLPRSIPALNSKHACKRRLAQVLEEKYKTIAAFNQAWETTFASFPEVADRGLPVKTRAAAADIQAFTGLFLETYFQLVTETFHKYDAHHMLIGNRFQSGTINNEQLCRISGKYMDVISFNYYTYYLDKDFLNRIYQWTGGKPMFLSEFYYNSPKDSGLPGGGKDVSSQMERGLGYRNYVEQAAALGYIVGIEWFTLVDQSFTGRFFEKLNGENGNTGLIAATDRPWKVMLAEMMKSNYDIYKVWLSERPPFTFNDPRFAASGTGRKVAKIYRTDGPMKINGLADGWPGVPAETISSSRLVQGADAGGVEASFKLCWDAANLYLLVHVSDPTPMKNSYKGDMIWSADGIELFIGSEQLDQAGPMIFSDRQILLSAGQVDGRNQCHFARVTDQPQCEMAVAADVDGKGYTLEVAIPFKALGFTPKDGQQILFDLAVDDSADGKARVRQLMWNGTARNSGDRTVWGRAVFGR